MLTLKDGQLWQATNTHLLVIYGDESLAEEDAFAQLCSLYLPHITQTDKVTTGLLVTSQNGMQ
ncbi:unnamed protein product [Gongylonema pulchrum]|uniref:Transcriptional regulator n=1 Tax=Gongylonema pulchrum TaxID=637853 RepID=A0A183DC59_9BILA|nr:unnamed protein product [Gongylonema pulchrum]